MTYDIKRHYTFEKELANRLKNAPPEKRKQMYATIYDELFTKVPDHPQLGAEAEVLSTHKAGQKFHLIKRYLTSETIFLEIGAGDGVLSRLVAEQVKHVYTLEVSEKIIQDLQVPKNVTVLLTDGTSIPVQSESVDMVFSNQVLEHLHPDDAVEQLHNITRTLKSDGKYLCITPHRFSGPHDVSQYFDPEATGLHLKEYTAQEMVALFKQAGFRRFRFYWGGRGIYIRCSYVLIWLVEKLLAPIPSKWRRRIARFYPIRALLGINMVAFK
jgi:2-polyprenyl-3-methyl-5-hydroxy-6-metoxy-1,4-benzoquinol methylase